MNYIWLSQHIYSQESAITFLQARGVLPTERRCGNNHLMVLHITDKEDRFLCNTRGCRQQLQLKSKPGYNLVIPNRDSLRLFLVQRIHQYKFLPGKNSASAATPQLIGIISFVRYVLVLFFIIPAKLVGRARLWKLMSRCGSAASATAAACLCSNGCLVVSVARPTRVSCLLSMTAPNRHCTRLLKRPSCRAAVSSLTAFHHTTVCPICLDTNTLMKRLINLRILLTQRLEHIQIQWRGCGALRRRATRRAIHKSMIDSYLCEFVYRRRHYGEALFDVIWTDIVEFQNNNIWMLLF